MSVSYSGADGVSHQVGMELRDPFAIRIATDNSYRRMVLDVLGELIFQGYIERIKEVMFSGMEG